MPDEVTDEPACRMLYKYVGIAGLKRILGGSIRFTQPGAFNDPFEMLPEVVVPLEASERRIELAFDVRAPRRVPQPGLLDVVPAGQLSIDTLSRDIVKELNAAVGIFCLSRRADCLLMWSHYADQYAGAVVGFDRDHAFLDGRIDVEYRATRPMRHVSYFTDQREPIPVAELCIKSEDWRYEREVRVVRSLADCHVEERPDPRGFPIFTQKLPEGCVRSITLGERTPVAAQRDVYDLVKDTGIILELAAIDFRGYAFRREPIKMAAPASVVNPWITPRTAHIFTHLPGPMGDVARLILDRHPMGGIVNRLL